MTEAVNKVEADGKVLSELGPYNKLLALYAVDTLEAKAEATKLTIDTIAETARMKKACLKVGGKEGAVLSKSVDWVRDYWLKVVAKHDRPEVAQELRERWVIAFASAPKPKENFTANLNLKVELAARQAELSAAAAKVKPQAQPEEAPEPEAQPEPEGGGKVPQVAFSFDTPISSADPAVLSHAASFDNAREFARRRCWKAGSLSVYAWGGKFWEWNERSYYQMEEAALKASVYAFLDGSLKRTNDGPARFRPKPRHVTELLDGLRAGLALPAWCEPPMRLDTGERAGDVLMFRNGLVEILSGSLVAPTPKLWVHDSVEYDWDPDAECPQWLGFLEGIFPGDQEAKDCLEEFLGLSQTEDVSFQKGLMAIGPPRSGKGTTLRISEWLGGTRAFISLDLDKWVQNENSGEGMIGKKVLAFPDVRLKEGKWYRQNFDPGGVDYKSVQRLLKITTADMITLGRKYIGPWEGVLPGKVWWLSNKIPNFNDTTLPTRFIKLAFDISYLNREDLHLSDRLRGELPGTAARCLAAYRRAKERGRLIQPRSGERLNRQIVAGSDPFSQFVTETFILDPNGTVTYARAMSELRDWCVAHGRPELLGSIRPNNIRKSIRAIPGFEEVAEAGRPHGEQRRMARIRLRKFNESMEDED